MRPIDADALIEFCAERWIPLNIDAVNMQPTIQPEKAQLSQEGTTSDRISRMETVERLRRVLEATVPNTDYDEGYIDGIEFAISTASTMPTIQPQSTVQSTVQSTDLIDRRAAIDALDFEIVHMTAYCDGKNEGNPLAQYNKGLEDGKKAIEALPTAQPEPQEGHWIRRDCGLDVECKCSRCGYKDFVEPRDEYWFNRNFCPNCGAKMTISTK